MADRKTDKQPIRPGRLKSSFDVSSVPIGARATEDGLDRIVETSAIRLTEEQ